MTATTATKSLKAIRISLATLLLACALAGCGDLICGSGSHMAWTGDSFDCVDDR